MKTNKRHDEGKEEMVMCGQIQKHVLDRERAMCPAPRATSGLVHESFPPLEKTGFEG